MAEKSKIYDQEKGASMRFLLLWAASEPRPFEQSFSLLPILI